MSRTTPAEDPQLWRYVDAGEYVLPSAPPSHQEMTGLWRRFLPQRRLRIQASIKQTYDLPSLSEKVFQRLVPLPGWSDAVAALEAALASYLDCEPCETRPAVVIGMPHSNTAEILKRWAEERRWRIIEPPDHEQILAQDASWLTQFSHPSTPWMLPQLERCYLRHPRGIFLIQRLLEVLANGSAGRCVLGCDSWAWAYLTHLPPGTDRLSKRFIAQAFDQDRLARWMRPRYAAEDSLVIVREADNGQFVLPNEDVSHEGDGDTKGLSNFLRHLAAYSLGNPFVARAVWLRVLRTANEMPQNQASSIMIHEVRTPSWRQVILPALPENARDYAILLHTLLLHNGVAADALPQLLPLSPPEIAQGLYRLCDAELIESTTSGWQVTAAGYPAVRKLLVDEGYLTDTISE